MKAHELHREIKLANYDRARSFLSTYTSRIHRLLVEEEKKEKKLNLAGKKRTIKKNVLDEITNSIGTTGSVRQAIRSDIKEIAKKEIDLINTLEIEGLSQALERVALRQKDLNNEAINISKQERYALLSDLVHDRKSQLDITREEQYEIELKNGFPSPEDYYVWLKNGKDE